MKRYIYKMTNINDRGIFIKLFLFAMIILQSVLVNAQSADTVISKIEDGWIEVMDDKVAIDLSLNNSFETFKLETTANDIILNPNTKTNFRFHFNYRFLSLGFQFAPDFIPGNNDDDTKGRTQSFELETSFLLRHWNVDLSYTKVKGYYLANTDEYIPWKSGDPYIQFPDLYYYGFTLAVGYKTNPKFSFRSLVSQTERQLKSAGSFMPSLYFRYYIIDDKSISASTQKSNNTELSIGPGYIYTFVMNEKFYISLGVLANVGYLYTKLTTRLPGGEVITNQDNLIFRGEGKAGIGYNDRSFYTGLYTTWSLTEYKQENTTVVNYDTKFLYHFFIGVRLDSPEFLKALADKIENIFP